MAVYRWSGAIESFYTGGPFSMTSDGSILVCACNNTINVVDTSNATIKSTLNVGASITDFTICHNDLFLSYATSNGIVKVRDLESLMGFRTLELKDNDYEGSVTCMVSVEGISSLALAAGSYKITEAGEDYRILIWDYIHGLDKSFSGHQRAVTTILFNSTDDGMFFSGSNDKTIRVWNLYTVETLATLKGHSSAVTSLALTEDGKTLLSAGKDKVVYLWDLSDYSVKTKVKVNEVLAAICMIPTVSSFSFATVGEFGIVRLWSPERGCLYKQKHSDVTTSSDEEDSIRGFTSALMFSSGQGFVCAAADKQFLYYKFAEDSQGCLKPILIKRLLGCNGKIVDMKFLGEEEQYLAVATGVKQVLVYDLASMSCSYALDHTDFVLCLDTCLSKTGKTLIVTGSKDKIVRVWDIDSKLCFGTGVCDMIAVGASKKRQNFFVSGSSQGELKVWSLDGLSNDQGQSAKLKSKAVVTAHIDKIYSIAIRQDDKFVCSGSRDRTAHVWKLPTLEHVVNLVGHRGSIVSVEFSPAKPWVLTASKDKRIKIWNINGGSCLFRYCGHTSSLNRASFLSSGTQFVSCGDDDLVKLWNVEDKNCIATHQQHEVKTLAVGNKTDMLTSGGSVVNIWQYTLAKEKEGVLGEDIDSMDPDIEYQTNDLIRKLVSTTKRMENEEKGGLLLRNKGREWWNLDEFGCSKHYFTGPNYSDS